MKSQYFEHIYIINILQSVINETYFIFNLNSVPIELLFLEFYNTFLTFHEMVLWKELFNEEKKQCVE